MYTFVDKSTLENIGTGSPVGLLLTITYSEDIAVTGYSFGSKNSSSYDFE